MNGFRKSIDFLQRAVTLPRNYFNRFSFLTFFTISVVLLFVGKIYPSSFINAKFLFYESLAPVLSVISKPLSSFHVTMDNIALHLNVAKENRLLMEENLTLQKWRDAAATLQHENKELRLLLNFPRVDSKVFITSRIIAVSNGPFYQGALIEGGMDEGLVNGNVVVGNQGLLGRIDKVGKNFSSVLLVTDLNSRIPVVIKSSNTKAILAGNNSEKAYLFYTPQNAQIKVGEEIITSGHGGVFPYGIPVGRVAGFYDGIYHIVPHIRVEDVGFVQVVDYGLNGVIDP